MKNINNYKSILVCVLFLSSLLFIATCTEKDNCTDVICLNDGVCNDGKCNCANGYLGDDCSGFDLCVVNNITCYNNGYCEDGRCICPPGYGGPYCIQTVSKDDYLGDWSGLQECEPSNSSFTIVSNRTVRVFESSLTTFEIYDLYEDNTITYANLSFDNDAEIPSQSLVGSTGTISGRMKFNSNGDLVFDFDVEYGSHTDFCHLVASD